jgi:hypothetical protein
VSREPIRDPYPIVVWERTTARGVEYRIVQIADADQVRAYTMEIREHDALGQDRWIALPFSNEILHLLAQSYKELRDLARKYL